MVRSIVTVSKDQNLFHVFVRHSGLLCLRCMGSYRRSVVRFRTVDFALRNIVLSKVPGRIKEASQSRRMELRPDVQSSLRGCKM